MSVIVSSITRRDALRTGAGLFLGFFLPERFLDAQGGAAQGRGRGQGAVNPNAYIHIGADESVRFIIVKAEMGQGTVTSLSQLLADELDCDWKRVSTEFAPVNPALYGNQGVYGSQSIRATYFPLRQAGATARAMLMEAAAQKWSVDKSQLRTDAGFVVNPATGAKLSYGSIAEEAAKLPVPQGVALKDPKLFKYIGKSVKRLDTKSKVNGTAKFGLDAHFPGMLFAVVERCPVFGGKVTGFDATKAKAVPGVKDVAKISGGVAVIAENTWAAMQGRKALSVQFDEGPVAAYSTPDITKMFQEYAQKPGAVAKTTGDAAAAMASATKKIEAEYHAPYQSHTPMEPMNCTVLIETDRCEIWASTQSQTGTRQVAAQITGLKPDSVIVHSAFMGGGFGRRSGTDYVTEAVEIAKLNPGKHVKLTWSREDDMRHDLYRPASYVKFSGAVDGDGWPVAFTAKVACPSFFGGGRGGAVDGTAVEGIHTLEYAIPNIQVDWRKADPGIPTTFWRAVGYTQNTFFAEGFIDELAALGGKDPLEVRRRMLAGSPRLLAVLNKAAEGANWGKAPAGHHHGVAVVNNIGSYTAMVAEISVLNKKLKVHRFVCAVDCGPVVNPAIVKQQIESGIVYGLTAALKGEITIDRGRVKQGNFHEYDMLRIDEMPKIDVHILETNNNPGGIGEASVPPVAPAIANAIFAATRKRVRSLPIRPELYA